MTAAVTGGGGGLTRRPLSALLRPGSAKVRPIGDPGFKVADATGAYARVRARACMGVRVCLRFCTRGRVLAGRCVVHNAAVGWPLPSSFRSGRYGRGYGRNRQ